MANIIITRYHQLRALRLQQLQIAAKLIKKTVFKSLPVIPTRTRWEINAHYRNFIKINADIAAFAVVVADTAAVFNMLWRLFGEDGGATITLFFGGVPVVFVA